MSSPQAEVEILSNAVYGALVLNYATAAALTWVVYDIVLTLGEEVSLVWRSKWSLTKVLYFIVRYYVTLSLTIFLAVNTNTRVSYQFCKYWYYFVGFSGPPVSVLFGEALFLLRIYASYGRSRAVLALVSVLYIGEVAFALTTDALEVRSIVVSPRPPNYPLPGCIPSPPKYTRMTRICWIYVIVVACIYFALIMRRFVQHVAFMQFSPSKPNINMWEIRTLAPILFLFARDGAFYFLVVLLCEVINLIFIAGLPNTSLEQMGTIWMMATYIVTSSRLTLNLRGSLAHGTDIMTDIEMQDPATEGTCRFASHSQPTTTSDTSLSRAVSLCGPAEVA